MMAVVIERTNEDELKDFYDFKLENSKEKDYDLDDNIALSCLVSNEEIFDIGEWHIEYISL